METLSLNRYGLQETQFTRLDHVDETEWVPLDQLDAKKHLGRRVMIRARLHHVRGTAKNAFLVMRAGKQLIQAVLFVNEAAGVTKDMVKFASALSKESILDLGGELVSSVVKSEIITFKTVEIRADFIKVLSASSDRLPFQIEDASRVDPLDFNDLGEDVEVSTTTDESNPTCPRVALMTRLNNRVVDLRTPANQAIFRMQSAITSAARRFLESQGFVEIHTPKLIGAASEGGANVFKVSYFKGSAYLAQSPQFYKQMAICGDLERVYEVGPVFRAENSFTHRHMTEFTGLDLEMTFVKDYHEVVRMIARMLRAIFLEISSDRWTSERQAIQRQFPTPEFLLPESDVLILPFRDGIEMLRADGCEIGDFDDLSTEAERRLGRLVRDKYATDFYVLDKYPLAVRPFYTMPEAPNASHSETVEDARRYSHSYDFFMRGEEIMSGAQRVHDLGLLEERIRAHGIDPATVSGYVDAFRYGVAPHAGGGIGLERVLMLYFDLKNIRRASMFPRDPHRIQP